MNARGPDVAGPLAEYVDGFAGELSRLGYTPGSALHQLRLLADLSRWLAEQGVPGEALASQVVERFLAARRAAGYSVYWTRLERTSCRRSSPRGPAGISYNYAEVLSRHRPRVDDGGTATPESMYVGVVRFGRAS